MGSVGSKGIILPFRFSRGTRVSCNNELKVSEETTHPGVPETLGTGGLPPSSTRNSYSPGTPRKKKQPKHVEQG